MKVIRMFTGERGDGEMRIKRKREEKWTYGNSRRTGDRNLSAIWHGRTDDGIVGVTFGGASFRFRSRAFVRFSDQFYCCAMGISFSPDPIAGSGASTVRTPSLLSEDLILSGFTPFGSRNSRLYSLYTDLLSVFSSCLAWTWTERQRILAFRGTKTTKTLELRL